MSLFSTIAHGRPVPTWGMPKTIWIMAAGLLLAVAVGFVMNNTVAEPAHTVTATNARLSHEIVRINTTALDALVPAAAAVEAEDVVDSFIYINTTALDGLASAAGAIEIQGGDVETPAHGPR